MTAVEAGGATVAMGAVGNIGGGGGVAVAAGMTVVEAGGPEATTTAVVAVDAGELTCA